MVECAPAVPFHVPGQDAPVAVERGARLLSVNKADATILSIQTSRGELAGKVFIDASYEGDLMALAGIEYRVGREPQKLAEPPSDRALLAEQEDHEIGRAHV